MSGLSIALVGSTAKPAYPLFPPAGPVAPSVSALDPYFQALDQMPNPSPGGSSDHGQTGGQRGNSASSDSRNTSTGLPAQYGGSSQTPAAGQTSPSPSPSVYVLAGPGRATVDSTSASSGTTVDTYA